MRFLLPILLLSLSTLMVASAQAVETGGDIEAATGNGDKVTLHPNGRWEFIDTQKATQAKAIADQYPENNACPPGSQGGYLGLGRCIPPGDKDFNRRSLGGK
jgi:hypothetical protein